MWYAILGCGPYGTDEIDPIFAALIPDWQRGYVLLEKLCENVGLATNSKTQTVVPTETVHALNQMALYASPVSDLLSEKAVVVLVDRLFDHFARDMTSVEWREHTVEIAK